MANDAERRRWNNEGWVAAWPERERLTDAVTPFILATADARAGQRVCDVGCGGGALSVSLADRVTPGGRVVGVDISAPLLELARRRAGDRRGVEFVQRDVQTDLQANPLPGTPFDLVVSQFGVMFFDEPLAAFTSIRRQLRQAGRFVFASWQGVECNPWHTGTALRSLLPPPAVPPPGKSPVGPFALGDDEYVRELLEGAGFDDVEGVDHEITVRGPASAVVDSSLFSFMGIPADRMEEAHVAMQHHLRRFAVGAGEYEYPLAFRVYESLNRQG